MQHLMTYVSTSLRQERESENETVPSLSTINRMLDDNDITLKSLTIACQCRSFTTQLIVYNQFEKGLREALS